MKTKQFTECAIVYRNALCSAVINILFFAFCLSHTSDDFILILLYNFICSNCDVCIGL